jgi:hypothetical protein
MSHRPLRFLPTRLSATAILETLKTIGIEVPLAITASANKSREDMGYAIRAAKFSISTKAIDEALAKTELSISEKLRFKYSLEVVGLY